MKKIALGVVGIFFVYMTGANAARLDVSRITQQDEFSATFGAKFTSGLDKGGGSQTDFDAGRVDEISLDLAYTFTPNGTITFSTDNNYSDSEVGIVWKLHKTEPLKIDFISDYGIAWTKNSNSGARFGENNVDAGFRIHGVAWCDFQWALQTMGQYVWADAGNFWNINMTLQTMYYFRPDMATTIELDYDILQINRPRTLYDRSITAGVVYNITETASVNPYVKYHFETKHGEYDLINPQNYWEIGAAFSTEF